MNGAERVHLMILPHSPFLTPPSPSPCCTSFDSKMIFVLDKAGTAFSRAWVIFELWLLHVAQSQTEMDRQDRLIVSPLCDDSGPLFMFRPMLSPGIPPSMLLVNFDLRSPLSPQTCLTQVLPESWCWLSLNHAYVTMDVSKVQATRDRERLLLLRELVSSQRGLDLDVVAVKIKVRMEELAD